MKATIENPDDLYREFKAETASSTDWNHFQPPLTHLVPGHVTDHSAEAIRKSINSQWNEPS
ncbi:MAG: hypothetical protein EAZ81_08515 [Verrucomicrobia bacterium]|nr:MAG: hypothetical protein EAZ81_08515 [Verrucomicrobiota bacterium]